MPTPTKGPRLGGSPAHERLLLANLATALFEHGRITTTQAKAKRLRPLAERLITFAKRGDLHARRQVLTVVRDQGVVHTLFTEIGPRFGERPGGYTRIVKLGPRKGDNAPMAVIELVEGRTIAQEAVGEAERARGTRFARRRGAAGTATPGTAGTAGTAVAAGSGSAIVAAGEPDLEPVPVGTVGGGAAADTAAEAGAEVPAEAGGEGSGEPRPVPTGLPDEGDLATGTGAVIDPDLEPAPDVTDPVDGTPGPGHRS